MIDKPSYSVQPLPTQRVADEFRKAGITTVLITGELGSKERELRLEQYASGEAQVIVNVAVLTEGWDHPPTSCVFCCARLSKINNDQMIGRGLRTVDARIHPGVTKSDCIILGFGTSSLTHGTLEQDIELDDIPTDGEALKIPVPHAALKSLYPPANAPFAGTYSIAPAVKRILFQALR